MKAPFYFTRMDTTTKHFYAYTTTVLEPGNDDRDLIISLPYTNRNCAEVHDRLHKMLQDSMRVTGGCYLLAAQEEATRRPYDKGYGNVL